MKQVSKSLVEIELSGEPKIPESWSREYLTEPSFDVEWMAFCYHFVPFVFEATEWIPWFVEIIDLSWFYSDAWNVSTTGILDYWTLIADECVIDGNPIVCALYLSADLWILCVSMPSKDHSIVASEKLYPNQDSWWGIAPTVDVQCWRGWNLQHSSLCSDSFYQFRRGEAWSFSLGAFRCGSNLNSFVRFVSK